MCGIVGYVGKRTAQDVLINGLKRLEYRGYDSSGIATLDDDDNPHLALYQRGSAPVHRQIEFSYFRFSVRPCAVGSSSDDSQRFLVSCGDNRFACFF